MLKPSFPPLVQSLLSPEAYPENPREIKLVQTQMSFVFLTGEYAYKVKKPVNFGFLDFSDLDKRCFYCHQEIVLNKRLCAEVYLKVAEIVRRGDKFFTWGEGELVEYAVKMRQLPQDRTMDKLLQSDQVTMEMIERVAEKLVRFHHIAETSSNIATFGKLDVIRRNTDENFAQTKKYIGRSISAKQYDLIKRYTEDFIKKNVDLFNNRIREGRIKDCHGDLHADHICFTDGICIFDCIEFNDRFRYSDVASEIAFLAMDLDRYRRADLAEHLVKTYVGFSNDEELLTLINFYKCYRAYIRGKVESFELDDPYIPEEEKAKALAVAQRYFELAESYTGLSNNKGLLTIRE